MVAISSDEFHPLLTEAGRQSPSMRTESTTWRPAGIDVGKWLTGAVAGSLGALVATGVLYATGSFDPSTVTVEALGVLFMPGAVFGLVYTAIASVDRVAPLAAAPTTGLGLGLLYSTVFWVTTLIGNSFSVGGLLAGLAFGSTIGILYALSPYVE